MTEECCYDRVESYDGARTAAAIRMYLELWESRLDLAVDDPEEVAQAAMRVWLAACIAFKCSFETSRSMVEGAFEISKDRIGHVNGRFSQTSTRALAMSDMADDVYDYLCIEFPNYIEEWAEISDALSRNAQ